MNMTYLQTIRGEETTHCPVWFMRQAGRSQAEYRRIKEKYSLFEITQQPELCAYITRLPVEEYNVDAAILYKDIMTPLVPIGVDVELKPGIGPVIGNPIRTAADIAALRALDMAESLPHVLETIRLLTEEQLEVPLIGFGGAPFTLASYMLEGGPSKTYQKTRQMLVARPDLWDALMAKLTAMSIVYLGAQIEAGASAIQIFDSWVGAVSAREYEARIYPFMKDLITSLKAQYPTTPITMFGVGTYHLLPLWRTLSLDVIGLDWRCSIEEAQAMGITQAVQGNLDPAYLFADWTTIQREIDRILAAGKAHGKHIFNLGHGVVPEANPEVLKRIVTYVHEVTSC
ncbi:uroporphyrinogen decarboxylase [Veillonella sp. R32]|uniref:uroporphyrinogen decarboxylase n=1 Tax=Veillonella sp. R32 TaxID=2021312 RepID=UPI00138999F9|nr:uroporphyrinogen decarboxylase [Veillonella sp. R32]KAF1683879.1 uroporphyrinogen decarboxylase [Veillonella sp. R32]